MKKTTRAARTRGVRHDEARKHASVGLVVADTTHVRRRSWGQRPRRHGDAMCRLEHALVRLSDPSMKIGSPPLFRQVRITEIIHPWWKLFEAGTGIIPAFSNSSGPQTNLDGAV